MRSRPTTRRVAAAACLGLPREHRVVEDRVCARLLKSLCMRLASNAPSETTSTTRRPVANCKAKGEGVRRQETRRDLDETRRRKLVRRSIFMYYDEPHDSRQSDSALGISGFNGARYICAGSFQCGESSCAGHEFF